MNIERVRPMTYLGAVLDQQDGWVSEKSNFPKPLNYVSILNLKNPTFPNNCISWDPQICQ